ncbi:MAG: DUF4920 domain-containing protein [Elusimicrobiota bacterium]
MTTTIAAALLIATSLFATEPSSQKTFGQPLTLSQSKTLEEALAAGAVKDEVLLSGKVLKVCKKKGCWLVLGDDKRSVRVTFKDYAFFVPKDSTEKQARVQGILKEELLSVKDARHFLKDEGASRAEIAKVKAPMKTWSFVASGVELSDRP